MGASLVEVIKEKQRQIAKLQAELDEARALLVGRPLASTSVQKALQPAQRAIHSRGRHGKRSAPFKSESSVGLAIRVLKQEGSPLHAKDLVERIGKLGHKVSKTTMVGNIARLVKAEKLFFRAGPNIFGLREWQKQ